MKYKNAGNILPEELLEKVQQYIQGEYLYIPIKEKPEKIDVTDYKQELQKRDERIYVSYLEGMDKKGLSHIYNLSESSIRRIICRKRKRYEAMKQKIMDILNVWDVEVKNVTQIYDSAWQVDDRYVLKVYDNPHMLERNLRITSILDAKQIPVGRTIYSKENMAYARDGEHYYTLSKRLPGSNIVSLKDNLKLAEEMGRIIGRLHLAFKECESRAQFWENSLLVEMKGWIRDTLSGTGWKLIGEDAFEKLLINLENLYENLPIQLIHRDVHFGNFLFQDGKFSGYIDFDLSQRNIRIFDVCYFMLGLLSEEEKLDITKEEWFRILERVFQGYQQISPLTIHEKRAVPYVMKSIELLFAAWFSTQNDTVCAEDAMKIFTFIHRNEEKIREMI